jgi:hypothetical protein
MGKLCSIGGQIAIREISARFDILILTRSVVLPDSKALIPANSDEV